MYATKAISSMKNTKANRDLTEREELRKDRESMKMARRNARKGKRMAIETWSAI